MTDEMELFEPMSMGEENWAPSRVKNSLRAEASKSSHVLLSRTPPSSQASEDLTSASNEPDGEPSASLRSTPTPAPSSQSDGPESPTSEISPNSFQEMIDQMPLERLEDWEAEEPEAFRPNWLDPNGSEQAATLRGFGHGWQGQHWTTNAVWDAGPTPPSGPEASPAKTSPSPASDEAWAQKKNEPAPASPTPSLTLWSNTDLPPSSSKTYRDSSPVMEARTLGRSSVAWASSGTGGPTGFSTLSSSECPSDDEGCSFVPSTLAQVLEPTAPQRFYLSARAAAGILRRATRRGRELPAALMEALTSLAQSSPEKARERDTTSPKTISPSSVRRLTPVECERLMGWPDGWTIVSSHRRSRVGAAKPQGFRTEPGEHLAGRAETTADGELLPLGLDSHRYRCCGNGVVSNVAEWIGVRLARAVAEVEERAA